MAFPSEIWRELSLLLPVNHLSLSKDLSKLYNEKWFEDKIKIRYSVCDKHDNSWEFLYRRSLKSGRIFKFYNNKIYYQQMNGIKIAGIHFFNEMILTFDGNLYYFNKDYPVLLDTNVMDINRNTYVKKNEWYYINEGIKSRLIIKINKQFLSCLFSDHYVLAFTKNKIYQFDGTDELIITKCKNIAKVVRFTGAPIIIRKHDHLLYTYDKLTRKIEKLPNKNVDKLFEKFVKLADGTIAYAYYKCNRYYRQLTIKPITTSFNNLIGTMDCDGKIFLLIENNVYKLKKDDSLKLIFTNIRNIGNGYFIQ